MFRFLGPACDHCHPFADLRRARRATASAVPGFQADCASAAGQSAGPPQNAATELRLLATGRRVRRLYAPCPAGLSTAALPGHLGGGISYLASERPRSEELIVALGSIPFVFFHVRFIRAIRRKDLDDQPLQIGCRFLKRIGG